MRHADEDDRHVNDLSQEDHGSTSRQERRLNSALYVPCSLVQLARVVVCVRVLVDAVGVMVIVLIGHIDVVQFT